MSVRVTIHQTGSFPFLRSNVLWQLGLLWKGLSVLAVDGTNTAGLRCPSRCVGKEEARSGAAGVAAGEPHLLRTLPDHPHLSPK